MSDKMGTVTFYVYGTVDVDQIVIPTALAGASVTVSDSGGEIVASNSTDDSGSYTFELQEGDYTATARSLRCASAAPRPAATST